MMKMYMGWCGYCSVKGKDKRVLVRRGKVIECLSCRGKSSLESVREGSPLYGIVRNYERIGPS